MRATRCAPRRSARVVGGPAARARAARARRARRRAWASAGPRCTAPARRRRAREAALDAEAAAEAAAAEAAAAEAAVQAAALAARNRASARRAARGSAHGRRSCACASRRGATAGDRVALAPGAAARGAAGPGRARRRAAPRRGDLRHQGGPPARGGGQGPRRGPARRGAGAGAGARGPLAARQTAGGAEGGDAISSPLAGLLVVDAAPRVVVEGTFGVVGAAGALRASPFQAVYFVAHGRCWVRVVGAVAAAPRRRATRARPTTTPRARRGPPPRRRGRASRPTTRTRGRVVLSLAPQPSPFERAVDASQLAVLASYVVTSTCFVERRFLGADAEKYQKVMGFAGGAMQAAQARHRPAPWPCAEATKAAARACGGKGDRRCSRTPRRVPDRGDAVAAGGASWDN